MVQDTVFIQNTCLAALEDISYLGKMSLLPLVREGHLPLTPLLLFWRREPHMGLQANRILFTAVVLLTHPGPSEMLFELKLLVPLSDLADAAE